MLGYMNLFKCLFLLRECKLKAGLVALQKEVAELKKPKDSTSVKGDKNEPAKK